MINKKEYIYEGAAIVGQVSKEEKHINVEAELKRMINEREVFTVKVTGIREDSVTVKVLDEYLGIIPKAQVSQRMYIKNNMTDLIGQNVPVLIKSFNVEEKTCILSRTHAISELKKSFLDEILPKLNSINKDGINFLKYMKQMNEGKDPHLNDYPIVKAKVISYDPDKKRVLLNIAGLDILGSMDMYRFDYRFIYNPEEYIEKFITPNTVIEVALLAYYDNRAQQRPSSFVVSRRHALENPWKNISKKLSVGDVVIVKALEKKDSHFFGAYDNFDLDIKCYYPPAPERAVTNGEKYGRRLVMPGKDYKVRVEIVNEVTRVLTASYIDEL